LAAADSGVGEVLGAEAAEVSVVSAEAVQVVAAQAEAGKDEAKWSQKN
jgi:hypothetical protein